MTNGTLKAKRLKFNRDLVLTLATIIESDQGEQRFSQILLNYGFVTQAKDNYDRMIFAWRDDFYLEPDNLLNRVNEEFTKVSTQNTDK